MDESEAFGLHLNLSKSELFCVSGRSPSIEFPKDLPINCSNGTELLGAPISSCKEFCLQLVSKRVDKIELGLEALVRLHNPQAQVLLLRMCAAWPKFNYITRVCHPSLIDKALLRVDEVVHMFIESELVGTSLPPNRRLLAHLPLASGGLSLPLSSVTAMDAYLGCRLNAWSLSLQLVRGVVRHDSLCDLVHNLPYASAELRGMNTEDLGLIPHLQLRLSALHCKVLESDLAEDSDIFLKATIASNKLGHASAWLLALPLPFANLTMEHEAFRRCLRRRLALCQTSGPRPCFDCKGTIDEIGTHASVCSISHAKHSAVSHALFGLATQAGFKCQLEVSATRSIDDRSRPADILISNFSHGRDLAIDVTIATALLDLSATIVDPLYAMSRAIQVKRDKYAGRLDDRTDFFVFPMDSSGGFHPSSTYLLKRLSSRLSYYLRISYEEALSRVTQRLGFALASVVGRGLARF
jgi:hypothetical protein